MRDLLPATFFQFLSNRYVAGVEARFLMISAIQSLSAQRELHGPSQQQHRSNDFAPSPGREEVAMVHRDRAMRSDDGAEHCNRTSEGADKSSRSRQVP
jgi:hypothetical protein